MLSNDYVKKTHKYITVVLDDVKIENYSFGKAKYIIDRNEKGIVSPKIIGSYYNYDKISFVIILVDEKKIKSLYSAQGT